MAATHGDSHGGMSAELDALGSRLMGDALDLLAEGREPEVLLAVQDQALEVVSYSFDDDGPEACLNGARAKVRSLASQGGDGSLGFGAPVRYALAYLGFVADEGDAYQDALMLEFGEKGQPAWSAYSLYEGRGRGEAFRWTDPAPAGEVENLL